MNLRDAVTLLKPVESHGGGITTNWSDVAARFREHKLNRVKPTTYDRDYKRYIDQLLAVLTSQAAPTTGAGALKLMKKGENGSPGRTVCIRRCVQFLKFAVKIGMDSRWLPPDSDVINEEFIGQRDANRKRDPRKCEGHATYMTDSAFLELYDSISNPGYRLAIGLCRVFGLRPVELKFLTVKGDVLHCNYRKRCGRGQTAPRDIEALDPIGRIGLGQQLLLELGTGTTKLPELRGDDLGRTADALAIYLRDKKVWIRMKAEALEADEYLSTYSFRHSFAYASSMIYQLPPKTAADMMGHSYETHMNEYQRFQGREANRLIVAAARERVLATST